MYVKHVTWRSSKHGGHASSILFSLQWLPEHPTNVGVVAMTQTALPCCSYTPIPPPSDSHPSHLQRNECSIADLNKVVGEEAICS